MWRELIEREQWGSLDDAWSAFRREMLEVGRELEIVDERGDPIAPLGDYDDEEEPEYD